MEELHIGPHRLGLLPQKAIYLDSCQALLVADVHLGKAETFQRHGVPVASEVNHSTLQRLTQLCFDYQPKSLWILGDLVHSATGLTPAIMEAWCQFLAATQVTAHLILGNHDRPLTTTLRQLSLQCVEPGVEVGGLWLSHEPDSARDRPNLCGHIHPCLRLTLGCDRLRLPCFHWQAQPNRLTLPAFGDFTGGYDIRLVKGDIAYVVAEEQVVAFGG